MKKQLLLTRMLLLVALLVGSVSVWADNVTGTLALNSAQTSPVVSNNVTFTWSSANIAINGGQSSGFKANSNMTITIPEGATLVNISKTNGNNWGSSATIYVYAGSDNKGTNIASIVMGTNSYNINSSNTGTTYYFENSTSKNAWITSLSITYTTGGGTPTVVTPTFLPAGGTYNAAQSVSISCATDGATIHYTTDGSDPTESSASYSSPISVTTTGTTIKAKAFKAEMDASSVATATYTIKPTTPTITGGANVTITGADGCTFYYTTATGSDSPADPNNESTEYTAPFTPADGTKIKAVAYDAYGNKSDATSVFTFMYMPLNPKNINSNYYVKVTDASTLENGDAILIVNETAEQALGAQSGNNCPDETVDISDGVISDKGEALKLILVKKTEKVNDVDTEVFYFYTGAGYLYAASSSKNYLKEQNPATTNARATISISNGDAAILFKGSYTHNIVRYNSGDGLFSCYTGGQNPVQIYKEVVRPVTVTSAEYGTLYYENVALEVPTGAEAYTVKVADEKLVRSKTYNAGDVIAAGTAVVVKATANSYAFTASDVEGVGDANNLLKGSDVAATTTGPDGCKFYKLSLDASNTAGTVGFYWGAADGAAFTSGAHKAYLVIPSGVTLSGKESFLFSDIESDSEKLSEETTGIRSIEQTTENVVRYNLAGQKVGKDYKGILVINGKKVIRK